MTTEIIISGKKYKFCRTIGKSYEDKFNRMVKLAYQFDKLDSKFDGMIDRGNGTSVQARLALACKLMMHTGIRIGNESSAEGYTTKPHPNSKKEPQFVQTYGLTTMLPQHVIIGPRKTCLNFIGKKQVENSFILTGKLAKRVNLLCRTAEDFETLFEISAYELTKFIKAHVGVQFSPKDFRTMRANMYAYEKYEEISERELPCTKREFNAEVKEICEYVSEHLNNTPGVCKASYIDHKFIEAVAEQRPITKRRK